MGKDDAYALTRRKKKGKGSASVLKVETTIKKRQGFRERPTNEVLLEEKQVSLSHSLKG